MREEVESRAAAERDGRHGVELLARVGERRLQPEGEQHDAGDHRQVEVAVRVKGEPVAIKAGRLPSRVRTKIAATSK